MVDLTTSDGMARAYAGSGQTWTANGQHVVQLDSISWDPDNAFDTGPSHHYYVAPTNGYYLILARVGVTGTAAGDSAQAEVNVNNTVRFRGEKETLTSQDITNATTALTSLIADVRFLNQGDQVQLLLNLLQAAGPGLSLLTGSDRTYLCAIRLL